jgi:integrase
MARKKKVRTFAQQRSAETLATVEGRHRDEKYPGLYLQVMKATGSKKTKTKDGEDKKEPEHRTSWLYRYQLHGRERWMGLGSFSEVSLSRAREKWQAARQLLLDGVDPLKAKADARAERVKAEAATVTFETAAQGYYDAQSIKWRNPKHRAQFLSTMKTFAYPIIGKLPVADIDTPLVLKVMEQHVKAERGYPAGPLHKSRPETASRLRGRIQNTLDWAKARGYRSGENPAAWRGNLKHLIPAADETKAVRHHAALSYSEVATFMSRLSERAGIAARALEFTILTAARTNEVIGARWSEIDFKAKVWTVPAERMKARKAHRVPLSEKAVSLLRSLPTEQGSDYIFIGTQKGEGISNMSMSAVLKRMHYEVTVHGFRSTFKDWAGDVANYPNHISEMALAHTISSAVEKAYRRGDLFAKRAHMMQAWEKFCYQPPSKADNVTPLRRGAK